MAFSVRSLPRCLKQDKSRIYSVGRQSPASKGLNTQAEEADIGSRYQTMTGEDIADWKDLVHAAVNCSVCELAGALIICSYVL